MVIGGQAVLLYGEPRLTKDIDITVGADLDRLPEVLRLVKTLGLRPLTDPETFTRQTIRHDREAHVFGLPIQTAIVPILAS